MPTHNQWQYVKSWRLVARAGSVEQDAESDKEDMDEECRTYSRMGQMVYDQPSYDEVYVLVKN